MRTAIFIITLALSLALNVFFIARFAARNHAATAVNQEPYSSDLARDHRTFDERFARFGKARASKADLLFVGDSIPNLVASDLAQRRLESDLPDGWESVCIAERCIPGVKTAGVLKLVPELANVETQNILLMCGTNDLDGPLTIDQIATTYEQISAELHRTHEQARMVFVSVLPLRGQDPANERASELNRKISELALKHRFMYIDLTGDFSDSTGRMDASLSQDGVHPTPAGCLKIEKRILSALHPAA